MLDVVAHLDLFLGEPRRVQAVWLSEVWYGYRGCPTFTVPVSLRESLESEFGPPEERRHRDVAIDYSKALVSGLPPRLHRKPWALHREGRHEEAEYEQLHEELEVAVRSIRRCSQRNNQIVDQREAIADTWNLPISGP